MVTYQVQLDYYIEWFLINKGENNYKSDNYDYLVLSDGQWFQLGQEDDLDKVGVQPEVVAHRPRGISLEIKSIC